MQTTLIPPFEEWREILSRNCLSSEAVRTAVGREQALLMRRQVIEAAQEYTAHLARVAQRAGLSLPDQKHVDVDATQPIVMSGHQPVIYHSGLLEKVVRLESLAQTTGAIPINVSIDTDEGDGGRVLWPAVCGEDVTLKSQTVGTSAALFKDQRVRGAQEVSAIFQEVQRDLNESGRAELVPCIERVRHSYEALSEESIVDANAIVRLVMTKGRYLELPLSRIIELPTSRTFITVLLRDNERFVSMYNSTLEAYRRDHNIKNVANPFPNMVVDENSIEVPFWRVDSGSRAPVKLQKGLTQGADEKGMVAPRGSIVTLLLRGLCSDLFIHGLGGAKYDRFVDSFALAYWGISLPPFVVASATRYLFPERVERYTRARGVRARYKEMVSHTEKFLGQGVFTEDEESRLKLLIVHRRGLLAEMKRVTVVEERSRVAHALNGVNRDLKSLIDTSSLAPMLTSKGCRLLEYLMWTIYRHTRGMLYLKLGTALHSESCEPMEVYRTLYDNDMAPLWARPQVMFHEEVAPGQKRFTEVGRIRVAFPEDMSECLAFGYDTWNEGVPFARYVSEYVTSRNHLRGTRYLFELENGDTVATLNTLRFARDLVGIASVAVAPTHRKMGYASTLTRGVMELVRCEAPNTRFMLFSEVKPTMYERLGFKRLPDNMQFHIPSIAMATGDEPISDRDLLFLQEYF